MKAEKNSTPVRKAFDNKNHRVLLSTVMGIEAHVQYKQNNKYTPNGRGKKRRKKQAHFFLSFDKQRLKISTYFFCSTYASVFSLFFKVCLPMIVTIETTGLSNH